MHQAGAQCTAMPATRSVPTLLPAMIALNLTAHLALSGGRLSGSLFTLRSGASEATMGVFMALFAGIPLFTSLRVGRWIDRAGARLVTRHGVVLILVGAWLPVVYLSVPSLFAMAMLTGIGFNLVSMSGLHSIGSMSAGKTEAQRLATYGWYGLGYASSAALGPVAAGWMIDHLGFRTAFTTMAGFSCIAAVLVFTVLRALPDHRDDAASPRPPAERRAWHDLLALPGLRRIFIVSLTLSSAWDLFVVMLPVVGTRMGFTASVIGGISSMFALGTFTSRALTPVLATRFHAWQNVQVSLLSLVVAFLLMPWAAAPWAFMALGYLFGAGVGLSQPNTLSLLHGATPAGRAGEALGLRYFLGNCSSVAMPVVFGLAVIPFGAGPLLWAGAALVGSSLPAVRQALRERR